MLALRLREEAIADLQGAASWYESQRPGLGTEFLDSASATFQRIAGRPMAYPVVHRETRRALMQRFPFAVFFRGEAEFIVVFAVMHASRHPLRWRQRRPA